MAEAGADSTGTGAGHGAGNGAGNGVGAGNGFGSTGNIGNNSASGKVKKNQDSDWGMGSLFGSSLSDELQKLDIMTMTPIEALNELYRLQQQAREEAGQG